VSAVSVLIFTVSALLSNNGESALYYRCDNVYYWCNNRRDTEREREKDKKSEREREREREMFQIDRNIP